MVLQSLILLISLSLVNTSFSTVYMCLTTMYTLNKMYNGALCEPTNLVNKHEGTDKDLLPQAPVPTSSTNGTESSSVSQWLG